MRKPELLMPAGNFTVAKIAIEYGADAIYIGGQSFGLRAMADNFTIDDIKKVTEFAHERGRRIYVTANIFAHNDDLPGIRKYFEELNLIRPDAVLISDPGVFSIAKELLSDIEIHISTQANNTNYATAKFWHDLGASRIVTARELSLSEIRKMRKEMPRDMEMETFVHGAMCISYSGRCLLSNYFTGRDANKGACTHPCRWKYALVEESREGSYLPIEEDERGSYIMNAKDLCMVDHLPDLIEAGVDSLKVEGRMKSALYVATTARAYRIAIDDYFRSPEEYESKLDWYRSETEACTNRTFSTGFFYGRPDDNAMIYDESTYVTGRVYLGYIEHEKRILGHPCYRMTQKNKFSVGDEVFLMTPQGDNEALKVRAIYDENENPIDSVPHSRQVFYVDVDRKLKPYDILRK